MNSGASTQPILLPKLLHHFEFVLNEIKLSDGGHEKYFGLTSSYTSSLYAKSIIKNELISRASQLITKTNQFNIRKMEYSDKIIQKITSNKNYVSFMVNLKDIYGNHGLIGLVFCKKINKEIIFVDTFLMSCRVIGRHLETWMLKEISNIRGYKYILIEYIPTKKNIMIHDFLKIHGFKKITKDFIKKLDNQVIDGFSNKNQLYFSKNKELSFPFIDAY